jgi:1,2-diacylglycerol 3-alpha-glucosyltransferase/glucuronosyltransferase
MDYNPHQNTREMGSLINGVKTIVQNIYPEIEKRGFGPILIYPKMFYTISAPWHHEIPLTIVTAKRIAQLLRAIKPDAVFNMTPEGPLGYTAIRACNGYPQEELVDSDKILYTSAYLTNLDECVSNYIHKASRGTVSIAPERLRKITALIFKKSHKIVTPTGRSRQKLSNIGVDNTIVWPGGVNSSLFRPLKCGETNIFSQYTWKDEKPVLLTWSRLVIEKNIPDFLSLATPGYHKVVIGDGPIRGNLEAEFADENTHFLGKKVGEDLAAHVRSAELVILPGKSETDGLVAKEAAASGVPVVAPDVQGPGDCIITGINGVLVPENMPLSEGIPQALTIDRQTCAKYTAKAYKWAYTTDILLANLAQIRWRTPPAAPWHGSRTASGCLVEIPE